MNRFAGTSRWSAAVCMTACVALSAPAARGAEGGVVVLVGAGGRSEGDALVEALRMYTRDLALAVTVAALVDDDPSARASVDGRQAGAALVVWFGDPPHGSPLYAFRVATGELRMTRTEARDDAALWAQTLALKLRALLVDGPVGLREWTPAAPPATPAAPEGAGSGAAAGRATAEPAVVASAPPGPRSFALEVATAYALDVPTDPALLRHGVIARVGLALARIPIAVELDGGYAFRAQRSTADGARLGAADGVVGFVLAARLSRPRYLLAIGARAALHITDVDATTADGRTGSARVLTAGLGGRVEARLALAPWAALFVAASAEALVPQHRFTVEHPAAIDLGAFLFQPAAGVVFRL